MKVNTQELKFRAMKFGDWMLFIAKIGDRQCVEMRSVIHGMGMEWDYYARSLIADRCRIKVKTETGDDYMFFMSLDKFKKWLDDIDLDTVGLNVRNRVIFFKNNCVLRLRSFLAGGKVRKTA